MQRGRVTIIKVLEVAQAPVAPVIYSARQGFHFRADFFVKRNQKMAHVKPIRRLGQLERTGS
jgi:hypothetical protein